MSMQNTCSSFQFHQFFGATFLNRSKMQGLLAIWWLNWNITGQISKCLLDTAHKTFSAQEVETFKVQLSTYNSFFTGEMQEDACECLILLIEIMDKGFGLCPTNANMNNKGSFSELLFSFVSEKYIICDICTMKSPTFETTSLLYFTPTDSTSMQELLLQEHKQKYLRPVLVVEGTLGI